MSWRFLLFLFELREGNVDGTRIGGFGSFRLLLGFFENEEFGTYTRYTYYKPGTLQELLQRRGRAPGLLLKASGRIPPGADRFRQNQRIENRGAANAAPLNFAQLSIFQIAVYRSVRYLS